MHITLSQSYHFIQTVNRLKDLLDKENVTYSIQIFNSNEGLQSLDNQPFSVNIKILISPTAYQPWFSQY